MPKMKEENRKYKNKNYLMTCLKMPLVEVLGNMEYIGIKVDKEMLAELGKEFTNILFFEEEIYGYCG